MPLVMGGAGLMGSNIVAALYEAARTDIVIDDALGADPKSWAGWKGESLTMSSIWARSPKPLRPTAGWLLESNFRTVRSAGAPRLVCR